MKAAGTWLFGAGVLTTARAIVEQYDPVSWSPRTTFDYTAAVLTSVMWLTVGIGLYLYWRSTPVRRGSLVVLIGAVGVSVAAIGNFLEDVVKVPTTEWLFLIGLSVTALALIIGGVTILSVGERFRWIGLFLILWVGGGIAPDNWGEFVSGFSLIGLGLWLLIVGRAAVVPGPGAV